MDTVVDIKRNTSLLSNGHRTDLCGWLLKKDFEQFDKHLKLQKFLFFYESFRKLDTNEGDFSSLKAYKNGPVYSDVYGDYTHRKSILVNELKSNNNHDSVDEDLAERTYLLISLLNQTELSELTHELNVWNIHQEKIERNVKHIEIQETDFTKKDFDLLENLKGMFDISKFQNSTIYSSEDVNYVFEKGVFAQLSKVQIETLDEIANTETLYNPVFVTLDEEGVMEID